MPQLPTCIGLHVDCGVMLKGIGVVVMAFTLFIGSVYLVLTAVLGRWMGYLVLMVAFSGWMIIQSTLWLTGFLISQGPTTPKNLGPRGAEPAWIVLQGGLSASSKQYSAFGSYPSAPWQEATKGQASSIQSADGAAQAFLAAQANAELGITDPFASNALTTTQFLVDSTKFATQGNVSLAVVQAHYSGGGPLVTVSMRHDSGAVPRYSIMFLSGSLLLFALHLPLLDRAEKKRKAFLTGGTAPAWYGPA